MLSHFMSEFCWYLRRIRADVLRRQRIRIKQATCADGADRLLSFLQVAESSSLMALSMARLIYALTDSPCCTACA